MIRSNNDSITTPSRDPDAASSANLKKVFSTRSSLQKKSTHPTRINSQICRHTNMKMLEQIHEYARTHPQVMHPPTSWRDSSASHNVSAAVSSAPNSALRSSAANSANPVNESNYAQLAKLSTANLQAELARV